MLGYEMISILGLKRPLPGFGQGGLSLWGLSITAISCFRSSPPPPPDQRALTRESSACNYFCRSPDYARCHVPLLYYYMRICYRRPICLLFTSFFNSHFFPNIPIPQPSLLPASRPLSSPSTSFYAHDGWPPPCFTLPSCISLIHSSFIALLSDIYSLYLLPPFWHFDRFLSLMNTNTAFL